MCKQEKLDYHADDVWSPRAFALPAILLGASAIVCRYPEQGLAVLLALVGLAVSPLASYLCSEPLRSLPGWVKQQMAFFTAEVWGNAVLEFTKNEPLKRQVVPVASGHMASMMTDPQVVDAAKSTITRALADKQVQKSLIEVFTSLAVDVSENSQLRKALLNAMRGALSDAVSDDQFMSDILEVMTSTVLKASKHQQLRAETLNIIKDAVNDALQDEVFVSILCEMASTSVVVASKNMDLRDALVAVTKEGVADALKDVGFIGALRDAVCETLQGPHIFRSAATGVIGSLNPFVRRKPHHHHHHHRNSSANSRDMMASVDSQSQAEASPDSSSSSSPSVVAGL